MKIICIGRNYAAHAEELNHLIRAGRKTRPNGLGKPGTERSIRQD